MPYNNGGKPHEKSTRQQRKHYILSEEEVANGRSAKWMELEITGIVCNISPQLFAFNHLTSLFLNDNNITSLPSHISRLQCLRHLDVSDNKLTYLPTEIGDLVHLRELLLTNNCLRLLPYELGRLFNLQTLGLKGNPLTSELHTMYAEKGVCRLLQYFLDNLPVKHCTPPVREWIQLSTPSHHSLSTIFTVMTYNILCDIYCTRQVYGYSPSWVLGWEYRRKGIIQEIHDYHADIICLQEVETQQYHNYFLPELKSQNYDGVFAPKSRAKTMSESESRHVDGCAIFYRTDKFVLLKEQLVEFSLLAIENAGGCQNMMNRVMTKDNIGLIAILETLETSNGLPRQPVMVANAHIHWDPEYSDVKLVQTILFVQKLRQFAESNLGRWAVPFVLCGDLNSLPESGVIEFLSEGRIRLDHPDFREHRYDQCLSSRDDVMRHDFVLRDAYADVPIPHTNYTFDFKGVIDYIFHSEPHLRVLGVLGGVPGEWLAENKVIGCPHVAIPSDHFSLLVELELKPLQLNGVHIR